MGTDQIPDAVWKQTTWEGNRRAQLRHALSLTLRERLQAVEDMAEVAQRLCEMREGNRDPADKPGSPISPLPARMVNEYPRRFSAASLKRVLTTDRPLSVCLTHARLLR
jgi:hypothetical protein